MAGLSYFIVDTAALVISLSTLANNAQFNLCEDSVFLFCQGPIQWSSRLLGLKCLLFEV